MFILKFLFPTASEMSANIRATYDGANLEYQVLSCGNDITGFIDENHATIIILNTSQSSQLLL